MFSENVADASETPTGPSSRIARYDEFFDPRKRATVYRKSNKADLEKHFQKLKQKNPILVVRRVLNHKGEHTTTEVDVKSPKLAAFLQDLYKDVEGLDIARNPPWCNSKLFGHSRNELKRRYELERTSRTPDTDFMYDLEVALAFVEEDHGTTFADADALLNGEHPCITFDLLWTLFRPGCLLYSYDEHTDQSRILRAQTYEVKWTPKKGYYALIRTQMVAHDGKTVGTATVEFEVLKYPGTRKLRDLPIYPLESYPEREALKKLALERGRKFVTMLKHSFREIAEGPAVYEERDPVNWEWELCRFSARGRVMIDPSAYRVWQNATDSLINPTVTFQLDPTQLTEEQLMLCTPIVLGFSFTSKQWGGFALDRLTDIAWSSTPFDLLVLNPKTKDLVHSMVKQHSQGHAAFDDIVKGKGKGLIGLLCGPPGCGKTLTAEAVAEITHCPLYCLSAGELGTDLSDVEDKLTQVLELAHKWKAVVLLDEADVFLAQRDSTDIRRNALVSIFLRKLEYYQGILILTTNLITQCDVAFESRIHFTIHYPPLSRDSQRQIWNTFISQSSGKDRITTKDIEMLSKVSLNGRQIKNSVAVAESFAAGAGLELSLDHVYTVLEVMRDWQKAKDLATDYDGGPSRQAWDGKIVLEVKTVLAFFLGILATVLVTKLPI